MSGSNGVAYVKNCWGGSRSGGGREEEGRGGGKWKQKVGRRYVLGIISEGTNAAALVFLNPEAKL